ncbi:hypothetical protein GQ55_5G100100 [Panicum hallii var. hallii]|uniref:Uncharacterized protein n=1 Tax=Panicum hallii var. hallii TaxID=1504633 RepID=A0A2T7DER0_9POAL|nr:hypothetical protein GQ55_5G100100 [Panicum hallii var. hallii]
MDSGSSRLPSLPCSLSPGWQNAASSTMGTPTHSLVQDEWKNAYRLLLSLTLKIFLYEKIKARHLQLMHQVSSRRDSASATNRDAKCFISIRSRGRFLKFYLICDSQ